MLVLLLALDRLHSFPSPCPSSNLFRLNNNNFFIQLSVSVSRCLFSVSLTNKIPIRTLASTIRPQAGSPNGRCGFCRPVGMEKLEASTSGATAEFGFVVVVNVTEAKPPTSRSLIRSQRNLHLQGDSPMGHARRGARACAAKHQLNFVWLRLAAALWRRLWFHAGYKHNDNTHRKPDMSLKQHIPCIGRIYVTRNPIRDTRPRIAS